MSKGVMFTTMFVAASLLLTGCEGMFQRDLETGSNLHYILDTKQHEYPFIGDVHPFYDQKSETWCMFYLDTSGQFNSKLLTSKNGISWEPHELKIHSGLQNYAVLNVFEKDDIYYSYYAEYQPSKSENLLDWYYAGGKYKIKQDSTNFPAGNRDPSVVYDKETDRFYSIAINYLRWTGEGKISNLAVGASVGNDQTEWLPVHKPVLKEPVTNSDYECPQLVKINNRWYVLGSRYGQSVHGVGRLSYFIGDEGVNPYDVDWTTKEEHFLTTEDLAAAQIAEKDGKFYVFGWIPRYYHAGFWGGHINLPTEVYQLPDGTLASRICSDISAQIRGRLLAEIDGPITLSNLLNAKIKTPKRFDLDVDFKLENGVMEISFEKNNAVIAIENTVSTAKVTISAGGYQTAEMVLREGALDAINNLRIIAEGKILQLYLNDTYSIVSRVEERFTADEMKFGLVYGTGEVRSAHAYRLKYREELTNSKERTS